MLNNIKDNEDNIIIDIKILTAIIRNTINFVFYEKIFEFAFHFF